MKWFRHLLRGVSLTGALFVFQACYGTPQSPYEQGGTAPMDFLVKDADTGLPVEGIQVSSHAAEGDGYWKDCGVTDANGQIQTEIDYLRNYYGPYIRFEDEQGRYAPKDTVLTDLQKREITIALRPVRP